MKKCSCGKIYTKIPKDVRLALDAIVPGYYFNCSCKSTIIFPVESLDPSGVYSRNDMAVIVLMVFALGTLAFYFLT